MHHKYDGVCNCRTIQKKGSSHKTDARVGPKKRRNLFDVRYVVDSSASANGYRGRPRWSWTNGVLLQTVSREHAKFCWFSVLLWNRIGELPQHLLLSAVHDTTEGFSGGSWLPEDLNKGRLEYFYFLVAGMMTLNLAYFLLVSHWYRYKDVVAKDKDMDKTSAEFDKVSV